MKLILFIILGFILLFIMFQFLIIMPTNKTEQQTYKLIRKYKDFEIRFYPSSTIATINSNAKSYEELSGVGFKKLAGYIFGSNEKNEKIAMTAPVKMDINDTVSTMSFVMPSKYSIDKLPRPNDPNVTIKKNNEEFVAVIQFGGYASDRVLKDYSEKLQNLLKENHINSFGNFRFFGYNPPYQIFNRRNEVVIAVEWADSSK